MAKECSESSVATSSSTPQNWWDLHHATSALSSWNDTTSTNPWQAHQNPNSNSSCEEEVSMSTTSFTYASNHSGLTVESSQRFLDQPSASSNELIGEHAPDTQLWNHVLLNVGGNGELQNSSSNNVGENLLDHALSSKSIYEPAFDYLKKMDNNWEFTNSNTSFNNINGFGHGSLTTTTTATATLTHGNERLNKLSNLVSHWSIAPPHTTLLDPQTGNISLNDHDHQFSHQATATIRNNSGFLSYYAHDLKPENEHHHHHASMFRHGGGGLINGSTTVEAGHENNSNYYYEMSHSPRASSARNLADSMTLSSRLTKPLIDVQVPKPYFKPLNLSDSKKHGIRNSSLMTGRERGTTNEGKKKRSEETTDQSVPKKPKNESSTASSSVKLQVPKVKLADKITALQQIVSPFGKTDTASVLYEAIGYIKFLQEQVQLLSNPYMKSNSHKDTWGGLERKEKGDIKVDLRSRGLCLVPISCTPKVYHENTGSDYWTPAYRGCLYR